MSCSECKQMSRRKFLSRTGMSFGALAAMDPLFRLVAPTYAASTGGTGNLLVLCELEGGLDGLSFLAPFTNARYISNRPRLKLDATQVMPIAARPEYGISNLFPYFQQLYNAGQCAIVQQAGYPDGNGSHFESQEIFEFGVRNLASSAFASVPWYERLRQAYFDQPYGVFDTQRIGDPARYGYHDVSYRQSGQDVFARLAELKVNDAANTAAQGNVLRSFDAIARASADIRQRTQGFTSSGNARGEFYRAAMLASANLGTQILKVRYGGFDTHGSQNTANSTLFPRLNNEFQQFVADMQAIRLWDRTTVIFYTEFGRRNYENGSPGTDHGHGGHMILCGPRVNGGLFGQDVTTSDLSEHDLPAYVDFRAVFSACIRDWLGFDPNPIFRVNGENFADAIGGSGVLFR